MLTILHSRTIALYYLAATATPHYVTHYSLHHTLGRQAQVAAARAQRRALPRNVHRMELRARARGAGQVPSRQSAVRISPSLSSSP